MPSWPWDIIKCLSWTRFGDARLMTLTQGVGQPLVLEEGIVLLFYSTQKHPNSYP